MASRFTTVFHARLFCDRCSVEYEQQAALASTEDPAQVTCEKCLAKLASGSLVPPPERPYTDEVVVKFQRAGSDILEYFPEGTDPAGALVLSEEDAKTTVRGLRAEGMQAKAIRRKHYTRNDGYSLPNARQPVHSVEQCVGCGEDVVIKRTREGDVLCARCLRTGSAARKREAQARAAARPPLPQRAVCARCEGLGIIGPYGGPFEPCPDCSNTGLAPNGGHYVWVLDSHGTPMTSDGVLGPYTLQSAKTFARIAATNGKHDRAVSRGRDPQAPSFEVVRHYRAGTGERLI